MTQEGRVLARTWLSNLTDEELGVNPEDSSDRRRDWILPLGTAVNDGHFISAEHQRAALAAMRNEFGNSLANKPMSVLIIATYINSCR